MPGWRPRYVNLATLAIVIFSGAAFASARDIPVAPFEANPYKPSEIRITSPAAESNRIRPPVTTPAVTPGNGGRKPGVPVIDVNRPAAPRISDHLASGVSVVPCDLDPARLHGQSITNRARQLERLRATAAGNFAPESQQLSKTQLQRLQASAAWQMGLLSLHGICTVLNTADAALWFERAYSLGEPLALAGLAWCEIDGCKSEANPAAAEKWIELLRPVDRPRAEYLQWLVRSRLAPLELPKLNQDASGSPATEQNRQLLANAARLGDTNAKIEMGLESVSSDNLPQALAYFNSAGARSLAAQINAGVMTERLKTTGRVPPSQRSNGISPGKSQSGSENFAQGQRYHRGQGVPSNYTEAIRLYQLAQNQGNTAAKKMLELIFSRPGPNGQIDLAWMQQLAYIDTGASLPGPDITSVRQKLKREPTPLFELVPEPWRRYGVAAVGA